ncbi:MAG: hypothetical protein EOO10_16045 [Chitinophagaceae bacterium]|nr:MAG: hypothetical protein EOO10_16045 [Chitinophagaceae bacterium]
MKAASVKQIKDELQQLSPNELVNICLRLSKFKKENKELISYLLFDASDEPGYVDEVKKNLADEFSTVNVKSLYITKKNLRRIIRIANRFMKYTDQPETPVQILLFLCVEMKKLPVNYSRSTSLANILSATRNKLLKHIEALHEDLQYEYKREFQKLID